MLYNLIIIGICFFTVVVLTWKQPNIIAPIYAVRVLVIIGSLASASTMGILLFWNSIDTVKSISPREAAVQFLSTFLVCTLTNIDNLAMFLVLFEFFALNKEDESRVLKIILIGKAIFRMIILSVGLLIIEKARWIVRLFSLPILYTGYDLATEDHKSTNNIHKVFHKLRAKRLTTKCSSKTGPLSLMILLISDTLLGIDSTAATLAFTNHFLLAQTANLLALAMQIPFYILLKKAQENSSSPVKRILGIFLICIGMHILVFG